MFLDQLYYFKRLSEVGQITKAAELLHVAQPTLSRDIRKLEEELGIELFRRVGRGVELTEDGRVFAEYVGGALAQLNDGVAFAKSKGNMLSGTVSIGGIMTLRAKYLPRLIDSFGTRYPGVNLIDSLGTTTSLFEELERDEKDAVFCARSSADNVAFVPILAQQLVVVAPREHRLSRWDRVSLDDIRSCEITTYEPDSPVGRPLEAFLAAHACSFDKPLHRTSMDEMTLANQVATRKGIGIGLLTTNLLSYPELYVIPFKEEETREFQAIGLSYRTDRLMSPALRAFIGFVESFDLPEGSVLRIDHATTVGELMVPRRTSL